MHLIRARQLGLLEVELADAAGSLAAWMRDSLPLGVTTVTGRRGAGRGERLVERLADPDVPLGEPAGRGPEDHLLHDRRVALVDRPGRPAGVGRGRHQDHRAAVPRRLDDRGIAVVERQRDLGLRVRRASISLWYCQVAACVSPAVTGSVSP